MSSSRVGSTFNQCVHLDGDEKLEEIANIPDVTLTSEENEYIAQVGNNKGCMSLKGGNPEHEGDAVADRWSLNQDLLDVAGRWGIQPDKDLVLTH